MDMAHRAVSCLRLSRPTATQSPIAKRFACLFFRICCSGVLAFVVCAFACPASAQAQPSVVDEETALILFLHLVAEDPLSDAPEEKAHAEANRARTVGLAVAEYRVVASVAKAFERAEQELALEARSAEQSLSARGETLSVNEVRGFSDRRVAAARSAMASIQQRLSPEAYIDLTSYVFSKFRRTIEVWE